MRYTHLCQRRIRYRNSVKSACAYHDADADTDYNLVMMKSKVQLKQVQRTKPRRRWDREKLKCPSISQDFAEKVNEGVEEQDQKSTEEKWEKLKSAIITA